MAAELGDELSRAHIKGQAAKFPLISYIHRKVSKEKAEEKEAKRREADEEKTEPKRRADVQKQKKERVDSQKG